MLRQGVTHRPGWSGAPDELPGLKVIGMYLLLSVVLVSAEVLQPCEALSVGQGRGPRVSAEKLLPCWHRNSVLEMFLLSHQPCPLCGLLDSREL